MSVPLIAPEGWVTPPGYSFAGLRPCRGPACGRVVAWHITPRGAKMPVDPDGTSHYDTCPDAGTFRRPPASRTRGSAPAPAGVGAGASARDPGPPPVTLGLPGEDTDYVVGSDGEPVRNRRDPEHPGSGLLLVGPMSGLPDYNRPAFTEAAEALRARGMKVTTPMDVAPYREGKEHHEYLRQTIRALVDHEGVVLLPGWRDSKGALIEAQVAVATGRTVLTWDGERLDVLVG